ncbi:Acetyl-CoA:oxalate CoA-transferase [Candidatus Entotheonellaceae bacterium PAL068K]
MQPLHDIRVLAVTVFLAGPFLSMNLARLGAEVIKVEMPGRGDPVRGNGPFAGPHGIHPTPQTDQDLSTKFLKRTQGVKSVTLNLKHPEGRTMLLNLVQQADVVIENLAPGSMQRLGLGYTDMCAVQPGIIYCSISGYGQTGPYASKPAHDPQIQGMSGIMDLNGDPSGPPMRMGIYISDLVTPLFAAYAILAALRHKEQTGQGQYLDVSMMDTLATLMFMHNLEEDIEQGQPLRNGNVSSGPTGLYLTQDADITLTAASEEQWRRLCQGLEAQELLDDPRFAAGHLRSANIEALRQEIQARLGRYTQAQAVERLEQADVPCAPVRTVAEIMADQHLYQRGTLGPMRHAALAEPVAGIASGFPVLFSGGSLPQLAGAPTLGMHNQEIFGALLGLKAEQLQRLQEQGVV